MAKTFSDMNTEEVPLHEQAIECALAKLRRREQWTKTPKPHGNDDLAQKRIREPIARADEYGFHIDRESFVCFYGVRLFRGKDDPDSRLLFQLFRSELKDCLRASPKKIDATTPSSNELFRIFELTGAVFRPRAAWIFESNFSETSQIALKYSVLYTDHRISLLKELSTSPAFIVRASYLRKKSIFREGNELRNTSVYLGEAQSMSEFLVQSKGENFSFSSMEIAKDQTCPLIVIQAPDYWLYVLIDSPKKYSENERNDFVELLDLYSIASVEATSRSQIRRVVEYIRADFRHRIRQHGQRADGNVGKLARAIQDARFLKKEGYERFSAALSATILGLRNVQRHIDTFEGPAFDRFGRELTKTPKTVERQTDAPDFDVVNFVTEAARERFNESKGELVIRESERGVVQVGLDIIQFAAVISEVFENASKYRKRDSPVVLEFFDLEGGELKIVVENDGPKLSSIERDIIPHAGVRGVEAQASSVPGSGMGLASAVSAAKQLGLKFTYEAESGKRQVDRHRVSITVHSKLINRHG